MNGLKNVSFLVIKLGGATLSTVEKIKKMADEISRLKQAGVSLIVVVSAMGKTTEDLIRLAHQVTAAPQRRELDMLLTTGERVSMSLLCMALIDRGHSALSLTGSQAGILTTDSHSHAEIVEVRGQRVEQALQKNQIVVLAGFQGISTVTKEITTLGRGGSDITAVSMADFLKADECQIWKEVPGVMTADPNLFPDAQIIEKLPADLLCELTTWGAQVVNPRAATWIHQKKIQTRVKSAWDLTSQGTQIVSSEISVPSFSAVNILPRVHRFNSMSKIQNFRELNPFCDFQIVLQSIDGVWLSGSNEDLDQLCHFLKKPMTDGTPENEIENFQVLTVTHSHPNQKLPSSIAKMVIPSSVQWTTANSAHFMLPAKQNA